MSGSVNRDITRPVAILNLVVWLAAFAHFFLLGLALRTVNPLKVVFYIACVAFGLSTCWAWFVVTRASERLGLARQVALSATLLLLIVVTASVISALVYFYMFNMELAFNGKVIPMPFLYVILNNWLLLGWPYLVFGGGVSAILAAFAVLDRERRLGAAHAAAQEARLSALRLQINPHFLFNSLNAVTELIAGNRRAEAENVVTRLSEFFRASLSGPVVDLIPLEDEIDTAGAYLAIEDTRFDGRMILDIDLPDRLRRALTPPLLLQPLVENAAKYAVAPSKRPVTIHIRAEARGDVLLLTVADDGGSNVDSATRPGLGVGLSSVVARLEATYGAAGRFEAGRTPTGFTAAIEIPLRFAADA